jgi:hypothetical protein
MSMWNFWLGTVYYHVEFCLDTVHYGGEFWLGTVYITAEILKTSRGKQYRDSVSLSMHSNKIPVDVAGSPTGISAGDLLF